MSLKWTLIEWKRRKKREVDKNNPVIKWVINKSVMGNEERRSYFSSQKKVALVKFLTRRLSLVNLW